MKVAIDHFIHNVKISLLFLKGSIFSCFHACCPCCCSGIATRTQMEVDRELSST